MGLGVHITLLEDLRSVPSSHTGQLRTPVPGTAVETCTQVHVPPHRHKDIYLIQNREGTENTILGAYIWKTLNQWNSGQIWAFWAT